jgi:hypothetical protein
MMTALLEMSGAFLLTTTLLAAAIVLAAFQLGLLITRDAEQRDASLGYGCEYTPYGAQFVRNASAGGKRTR